MNFRLISASAIVACAVNVILGASLWGEHADRSAQWIASIAFTPVVLLGFWMLIRPGLCRRYSAIQLEQCMRGVALAGWLISISLGLELVTSLGWAESALSSRLAGTFFALVITIEGNRIPKVLAPLALTGSDPAAMQHHQRFAGWSLTLAGLTSLFVWIFAPVRLALVVAPAVGIAAILAIIVHIAWRRWKSPYRGAAVGCSNSSSAAAAAAGASSSAMM